MTKAIKLIDLPRTSEAEATPEGGANWAARKALEIAKGTATLDQVRTDVALALSRLELNYDLDFTNVHGKSGPDGVEYSLTLTVRSK